MAKGANAGIAGILLVVLLGLGGFNYYRNYQLERVEAQGQTFSGYDDASLEALAQAYEAEAADLQARYDALRGRRADVGKTHSVGEGVRQFERVQASTRAIRSTTEELATSEARLRDIREELQRRSQRGGAWAVHLERLTGLELPI